MFNTCARGCRNTIINIREYAGRCLLYLSETCAFAMYTNTVLTVLSK